jgi:hypothetical protein|tara:strand:- start:190 stop:381 length:192 start_codon:yes stop_codon:yes gene_type:complete
VSEEEISIDTQGPELIRVEVKRDGFMFATYVSSEHLVDDNIDYLRKKIDEEARQAYLRQFDDV